MLPRSRLFLIGILTVLLTVVSGTAARSDEADESKQQIAALIRQLGDSSYQHRQLAGKELLKLGLKTLPALRDVKDDPDLEIRYRAKQVLKTVERLEHERKLQVFLKAPNDLPDDFLPGWKHYRRAVGSDKTARELFVAMQTAEPELFRLTEKTKGKATAHHARRCLELQQTYAYGRGRSEAVNSVCALVFVAGMPNVAVSNQTGSRLYGFMHYNEMRNAIRTGPKNRVLRKLIGQWVANGGGASDYQKTILAMRYGLPEGLTPAMRVIDGAGIGSQMQYAILAVGKLGNRSHLPKLQKLFDNKTVLSMSRRNNVVIYSCQVRDIALAAALHLTKQDPKSYGFSRIRPHNEYVYSLNTCGFENDTARNTAFRKWKESGQSVP